MSSLSVCSHTDIFKLKGRTAPLPLAEPREGRGHGTGDKVVGGGQHVLAGAMSPVTASERLVSEMHQGQCSITLRRPWLYLLTRHKLYLLTPSLFLPLNCRSRPLLFTGTPFDTSPSSFSLNILARPLLSQTLRMDFH